MKATGESFSTELDWVKTYKIAEFKNYFLVYNSKAVANIILKKNMLSDEIIELRELFRSLPVSIEKKLNRRG